MDLKLLGWGATAVGFIGTGLGISRKSFLVAGAGAVITSIGVFLIASEAEAAPPAEEAEILAFAVSKG